LTQKTDEFLATANKDLAIFSLSKQGGPVLETTIPANIVKKKAIAFIKYIPSKCTNLKSIKEKIFSFEFTGDPLSSLYTRLNSISHPMFLEEGNRLEWPNQGATDILLRMNDFLAQLYQILGKAKGETLLPPPPSIIYECEVSTQAQCLETCVLRWMKQIESALAERPEDLFNNNAHPTPKTELDFWNSRKTNLKNIITQLQSEVISKPIRMLTEQESPAVAHFEDLNSRLYSAAFEADSNFCYLNCLADYFSTLDNALIFDSLKDCFRPMMFVLLKIWKDADCYATNDRLTQLLTEINNAIISKLTNSFISWEQIQKKLNEDIVECLQIIDGALEICELFQEIFQQFRQKSTEDEELKKKGRAWTAVVESNVFSRMEELKARCADIKEFSNILQQFSSLEKVVIGGNRGEQLSGQIVDIHKKFSAAVNTFLKCDDNLMDIGNNKFDDEFYQFRQLVKTYEKQISVILDSAFAEIPDLEGKFKLIQSFEGLINRPLIKDCYEQKQHVLAEECVRDFRACIEQFEAEKENPQVQPNLPPKAGCFLWASAFRQRGKNLFERLSGLLDQSTMSNDDPQFVSLRMLFESLDKRVDAYQSKLVKEWASDISSTSQENLKKPILSRMESGCLRVNFDPNLQKLTRESKYFSESNVEIPKEAQDLFAKRDDYRQQINSLQLVVNMYNAMKTEVHDTERPLIERKLSELDKLLEDGICNIQWNQDAMKIQQFIAPTTTATTKDHGTYLIMRNNLEKMKELLLEFSKEPLAERKNKSYEINEFKDMMEKKREARLANLQEINTELVSLINQTNEEVQIAKATPAWGDYIRYCQEQLEQCLAQSVENSIDWMCNQLDKEYIKEKEVVPLIEVHLGLYKTEDVHEIRFSAVSGGSTTVWSEIDEIVRAFFKVGEVVKKIDGSGEYFVESLRAHEGILKKMERFKDLLNENEKFCTEFREKFTKYDHLYNQDRNKSFKAFLASLQEKKENEHYDDGNKQAEMPPLDVFKEKINFYKALQKEIDTIEAMRTFGWIKLDCAPLKIALYSEADRWSFTYTDYLFRFVTTQISGLCEFMETVSKGLQKKVESDDLETLKFVLDLILQVTTRTKTTPAMFKPLREGLKFLQAYDLEVDEKYNKMLEDAPLTWESTVDQVYKKKEVINPLQNLQVDNIKRKVWDFTEEVMEFRKYFRDKAPFQYGNGGEDVPMAYSKVMYFFGAISEMDTKAKNLNQLESLFELPRSKYRALLECQQENRDLKTLWDMVSLCHNQLEFWSATLWHDIDAEELLNKLNKLVKRVNNMNKDIRGWKAFQGLQDHLKSWQTSLPLVNLLHSETMKSHHWDALSTVTKKDIKMPPGFTLGNMLAYGLHEFVEEVEEVVETSEKEAKIDTQLKKLTALWKGDEAQCLSYGVHDTRNVPLVRIPEEVMVDIEESMAILQGIKSQGKYAEFFSNEISVWERELGVVETVVSDWLTVQGKWSSLQSIFLAAEDIRTQLPEDAARFDGINTKWETMMNIAKDQVHVIECCTVSGRAKLLETMKADLELCEKSLNQYLETKKMKFPRFYFLSNTALLDLLSNGNNPVSVQKHMGDCFDNVKKFDFAQDADGNFTKDAIRMYSKNGGEMIDLVRPQPCTGAVEDWLNKLVDVQRDTMRNVLDLAKASSENWSVEEPRDKWLFNYPAQMALTASQILWCEEVEYNFLALEDGNETALKDYYRVLNQRLKALIILVMGKLNKRDRTKIMTLITVDVHNRDIVDMLVQNKVENAQEFAWQSQMRYSYDSDLNNPDRCKLMVYDAAMDYCWEYIGNTGRLVITPLTDRCYITLTQALNLKMGGAPAGPAGTGKTETVKDLGRALANPVYVFNCSEQMNVLSLGNIFKGLCQTGAWGCFDEFNRIPIEVLSVVATQVSCILAALRGDKKTFDLMGVEIRLKMSVGIFITMNPGYAGRTELPENLKALFRSCAMVVPDLELICENMLMSEGFQDARELAHKFFTLYSLSKELLSQQIHYDWGLRACKAVLRVAGALKRQDPDVSEDKVLMRALRDFNLPKIVADDKPIFQRLITDLFVGLRIDRKVEPTLQEAIVTCTKELKLQTEDMFVRKCTELAELLDVRHSVFIVGPAATGKSSIWSVLCRAYNLMGQKCVHEIMNPKAVESNELYGWLSNSTGDWYDGILSTVMRNMSRCEGGFTENQIWKMLILDTDVDPEWIESMNTVMDDNKVLTLVSNERIPFADPMRLLIEVMHLQNATPATVSRAGILYVNPQDVGWKPMVDSWIDSRPDSHEQSTLRALFNKYITPVMVEEIRRKFHYIVDVLDIQKLQTMLYILDGTLTDFKKNSSKYSSDIVAEMFEKTFCYAAIWAFGGSLLVDSQNNFKEQFSEWWKNKFPILQYPYDQDVEGSNMVFDYYFDVETNSLKRWEAQIPKYEPPVGDLIVSNLMVHTTDTVRLSYYMNALVKKEKPVMFIGIAGTGKTALVRSFLQGLPEDTGSVCINLNSYTDATALRKIMQQHVDKRSGRTYGPAGGYAKLAYFMDDINMPYVDTYGTQSPIALIRCHRDWGLWYDTEETDPNRKKKYVRDILYLAAMNNKAGSFNINSRLMTHFGSFSLNDPERDDLFIIFKSILEGHLYHFEEPVQELCVPTVNATIDLLTHMQSSPHFKPDTTKFHYQFNLRDIASVFQGLVRSNEDYTDMQFSRLWVHECNRVFSDRLCKQVDIDHFSKVMDDLAKKYLPVDQAQLMEQPNIFTNFVGSTESGSFTPFQPCDGWNSLSDSLEMFLQDHNENNAEMELVLFEMAIDHISRIARIIGKPRGNALLIGVGGSGKQSLSRLASWICGYEVFQIAITRHYAAPDFLEDIKGLYMKTVKGQGVTFLLTDAHVVDEKWLVYINDILSSGEIPQLFTDEEKDSIFSTLRNEAKGKGVNVDDKVAMNQFFINKFRANLHLVLCMSPVGDILRVRCRKFPAIMNCTAIDWFFSWPRDALCKVAERFLDSEDLDIESAELRQNLAHHMAEAHLSVDIASEKYLAIEHRYNYTTPKSFLELIDFYKKLYKQQSSNLYEEVQRLKKGIATLQKTEKDVNSLSEDLGQKLVIVAEKEEAAKLLINQIGEKKIVVDKEKAAAQVEQDAANVVLDRCNEINRQCKEILDKAMPAMKAAEEAVGCLSDSMLGELRGLNSPDDKILSVTKACLILLHNEKKDYSWKRAKKMMGNLGNFKKLLSNFDGENISESILKKLQPILDLEYFNVESMSRISKAAANLAVWVIAIRKYNEVAKEVTPLKKAKEGAEGEYNEAMEKLEKVNAQVQAMEDMLAAVEKQHREALDEQREVQEDATRCKDKLALAERLVGGLADENQRWSLRVKHLEEQMSTLVGDVLLSAAFVSYVGAFNAKFRTELWNNVWVKDIVNRGIPLSDDIKNKEKDPSDVLTTGPQQATWANEGLPCDKISIENAAIITLSSRWPLMIDPQLQGIKWIKNKYGDQLEVISLNNPRWLSQMIRCVEGGKTVLIENVSEDLDPALDPILSRQIIKKGRSCRIRIAGEEIDYDPKFKLFLQTKLANPNYKPEIFAQCSLVNFIVTESGLEEQLLALVVNREQPQLEKDKQRLVESINEFMVKLNGLENDLLKKLSEAPDDILSDISLIDSLENTKQAAVTIEKQVEEAKNKEIEINKMRNQYRSVAQEASWIYFLLIKLNVIDHMYQYSLGSFISFFFKAMDRTEKSDDIKTRVKALREKIRFVVFTWVSRGLFECHKLIFSSQLTFLLMSKKALGDNNVLDMDRFDYLIRGPRKYGADNPCSEWLSEAAWTGICQLSTLPGFEKFMVDIGAQSNRFKEWYLKGNAEDEPLPSDWRKLDQNDKFGKLLVVRAMRPDRMVVAVQKFVTGMLPDGKKFTELDAGKSFANVLELSLDDSTPYTPLFFILSSGSDPVSTVYDYADRKGLIEAGKYHRVALGQGQDKIAMEKLDIASKEGHWVVLENIHLMPKWCKELEKTLDHFQEVGIHDDFRLFLSAEPSKGIPIGVLERSIKLTNEPPQGMKANLKRALASFDKNTFEDMDQKIKTICFTLCWYHSVLIERKKFGPKGWNAIYPFSTLDLQNSGQVLVKKLESGGPRVPWADLRYIFGEIMYGGHITDDLDRLLNMTYLEVFLQQQLLDDEMNLIPFCGAENSCKFIVPQPTEYEKYFEYIDNELPGESPYMFGLHPNTEIAVRTDECNDLFSAILDLQPRDGAAAAGGSSGSRVENVITDIEEQTADIDYDMDEILGALTIDDRGPYQYVFLQEVDRMNILVKEMKTSLHQLKLGIKGELTMSERMETLQTSLMLERVPATWSKLAYPSLRGLGGWVQNLVKRSVQLQTWIDNPTLIPECVNISYFFTPQSFLTAVMQVTARKNQLELDKLCISIEVTKKDESMIDEHARDGAYICGLNMEGAGWSIQNNCICEAEPRQMFFPMPVVNTKAVLAEKMEKRGIFQCPVYQTQQRGPTFIFQAPLKTKDPSAKWVLAGAVMIMDFVQ